MLSVQLAGLAVGAPTAHGAPVRATSPPSPAVLTGEMLQVQTPDRQFLFPCDAHGGSYTVTFTTSGAATGPYPGTFVESVTFSYTLVARPAGPIIATGTITEFSADFTITSTSGTVTGTKSLNPGSVSCGRYLSGRFSASDLTAYSATILTPTGRYRDGGTSTTSVSARSAGPFNVSTFDESFASALAEPVLIVPHDKEQCRHGGYLNYPQFKNQGQCIRFVVGSK